MNGTGPNPTPKDATNVRVASAERGLIRWRIPKPRSKEEVPIPAMDIRRQVFRPILSERGAHAVVMRTLRAETQTVRRAAVVGRREERRETEYMTMEFMPVSCWVVITATTAMIAGRYWGDRRAAKMPMFSVG